MKTVTHLSYKELDEHLHTDKERLIIDIRSPTHYERGHIVDAINIPFPTFEEQIDSLPTNKEIVLVCYMGVASRKCANLLVDSHSSIINLNRGMSEWQGPLHYKTELVDKGIDRKLKLSVGLLLFSTLPLAFLLSPWFSVVVATLISLPFILTGLIQFKWTQVISRAFGLK